LALALYAVLVYRPLSQKAANLDEPLSDVWRQLRRVELTVNLPTDANLSRVDLVLRKVEETQLSIERAQSAIAERFQLTTNLQERLAEPFQLIEFQSQRQTVIEDLWSLANEKKVALDAPIIDGFPEYTFDRRRPELLWLQLNLLDQTLTSAIRCGVGRIRSVSSPQPRVYSALDEIRPGLVEVPLEIELSGPAPAIARFLQGLPLKSTELKQRSLPEAKPAKPVTDIDRIFARKDSKEKLDDVYLRVTVSTFAYTEPV